MQDYKNIEDKTENSEFDIGSSTLGSERENNEISIVEL